MRTTARTAAFIPAYTHSRFVLTSHFLNYSSLKKIPCSIQLPTNNFRGIIVLEKIKGKSTGGPPTEDRVDKLSFNVNRSYDRG